MSSYHRRDDWNEKNLPPPPSSFRPAKNNAHDESSRKIRNIATAADYAELERVYTFVPEKKELSSSATTTTRRTTWQERMANHYHSQLYKEYVLADFRRPPQVGLRWRTKVEVETQKGHKTCGNKHCSSYAQTDTIKLQHYAVLETNQRLLKEYYDETPPPSSEVRERFLLERLPHGIGLQDYEVNFAYEEGGQRKNELVKLRLCLRCAPLLFQTKGPHRCLEARWARDNKMRVDRSRTPYENDDELQSNTTTEPLTTNFEESMSSSTSERKREKRRKEKKMNPKSRHDRKRSMSQSENEGSSNEDDHSTRYRLSKKRERKHHKKKKRHKTSRR